MLFSVLRSLFSGGSVDFMSILMQIVAVLFVIFCILPLHEFAHGWVAYKLGDNTAKYQGRLTFNPISKCGPVGSVVPAVVWLWLGKAGAGQSEQF